MKHKRKSSKKQKPTALPEYLITLYNFDPRKDEVPTSGNTIPEAQPDVSVLMEFVRGDKLMILSQELDWWLMCKSLRTGQEGYVFSTLTAPFAARYKLTLNPFQPGRRNIFVRDKNI